MASPRKSGGAKSAPVQAAPEPIETVAEAPAVGEPIGFVEPVTVEASPLEVDAVPASEPVAVAETAPIVEAAPVIEAEPVVEPAPIMEAAPVLGAPPTLEAAPVEANAAPQPVAVETTAEKTETLQTVSTPSVNDIVDVNKILEAPLASLKDAQGKARSFAEAGIVETRAKLSQFKSAADEAASAIETSYATVKNGAVEFNTKAIEAFKATAEANFDFVKSVIGAKTPSEYVTLHSEFARKQLEALQAQTKSFGELAQKIATDSVGPIKAQVAKTFNLPL